jgi:glutathione synthase/RimK-type ligase-like ATP-grasp enzyme
MISIALVTAAVMPKPDLESHLLVESLHRRGVSASLVPWDSTFDWALPDLVVVRTPWDYFHRLDEFLRWADAVDSVTRLVNPAAVLRWNTHKSYLLALAAAGVPTVPTQVLAKGTSDISAELLPAGDIVVKPAVSIGAIGSLCTQADDPRAKSHIIDLATSGDVLVQPFIPSVRESGETSMMFAGGRLSHSVRKVPVPGEYRVQDHHGGSVRPHRATDEEIAVAHAALAVAPASLAYGRVDVVSTDQGPVVMELELVEPALFLDADPDAPDTFADALLSVIDQTD